MSKDIKITAVNPALFGGLILNGTTSRGRGHFYMNVTYTLENGVKVAATVSARRKKDVLPSLDSTKKAIAAGAMLACFSDDGEFWGTTTRYNIGPSGMVPNAYTP